MNITKRTTGAISGLTIALALSGCWASREETNSQLDKHIKAYESVAITPGNAKSIIKGIDVLTSTPEKNNFLKEMDEKQIAKLGEIKANARAVANCTDTLNTYEQSAKEAKPKEIEQMPIYTLESTLATLREAKDCVAKADVLSTEQVTSLSSYTEKIDAALKKAVAAETAKKAAEEAAKKAAAEAEKRRELAEVSARESRINRFIASTGMKQRDSGSYDVDKVRKDIDRAMLRALEKNCEDWLPSSCMREYGITIYDFDLVREKLGL